MREDDLARAYKHIYEFPPDEMEPAELRWAVAYGYYRFYSNCMTAAHVLLERNWDGKPEDIVELEKLTATLNELPKELSEADFRSQASEAVLAGRRAA